MDNKPLEIKSLQNSNLSQNRKRRIIFKKYKPFLIVAAAIILAGFLWSFLSSTSSVFKYAFSGTSSLQSTEDRVNFLLLGNAGGTHDGPYLTDSIIIASYHLKSHKVTLISVPRDLYLEGAKSKVNAVYEIGQSKDEDGLKYAQDKIDDILGIPIHYGVRLDFGGFAKAIDLVGGVDIDVPNAFDDYNYPIEGKEDDLCGLREEEQDKDGQKIKVFVDTSGQVASGSAMFDCRYEHLSFDKGKTHMNGETALKFVRSRMGTNNEGSDFARSRRQQLVIQAFREKALSIETLFNPAKISSLISTFGKSVETNIGTEQLPELYTLVKKVEGVRSLVLGDLGDGKSVFIHPPNYEYGSYVLIPPNNDFSSVKDFIKQKLSEDAVVVEESK